MKIYYKGKYKFLKHIKNSLKFILELISFGVRLCFYLALNNQITYNDGHKLKG